MTAAPTGALDNSVTCGTKVAKKSPQARAWGLRKSPRSSTDDIVTIPSLLTAIRATQVLAEESAGFCREGEIQADRPAGHVRVPDSEVPGL